MDSRSILERIIDEGGKCDWAFKHSPLDEYYICSRCPMSKLRKKPNGEYMSCFEALGGAYIGDLSVIRRMVHPVIEQQLNKLYLDKAKELLSDDLIEDLIKEEE